MVIDKVSLLAGVLAGALLCYLPANMLGEIRGRAAAEREAMRTAIDRVEKLEKSNAKFNSGTAHDRCVIFMRDSGLSVKECD